MSKSHQEKFSPQSFKMSTQLRWVIRTINLVVHFPAYQVWPKPLPHSSIVVYLNGQTFAWSSRSLKRYFLHFLELSPGMLSPRCGLGFNTEKCGLSLGFVTTGLGLGLSLINVMASDCTVWPWVLVFVLFTGNFCSSRGFSQSGLTVQPNREGEWKKYLKN